jgi:hypothetical protein
MVRALGDQVTVDPITDPPKIQLPPDFESIVQYLLDNKVGVASNKPFMVPNLIMKLRGLKGEDGSSFYKNYGQFFPIVTQLKSRLEAEGVPADEFFKSLNSNVFGLSLVVQEMTQKAFFPDEPLYGKPYE